MRLFMNRFLHKFLWYCFLLFFDMKLLKPARWFFNWYCLQGAEVMYLYQQRCEEIHEEFTEISKTH